MRASVADLAATIPVTLDQIEDVLDTNVDEPAGATFDAAEPVGGYEIAEAPAAEVADDEIDLAASEGPLETFSDAGSDDTAFDDGPEPDMEDLARQMPSIEELSDRIDSAFDDLVSEAEEVSEGSHRPWEDD